MGEEWRVRAFDVRGAFTMFLRETGVERGVRLADVVEIVDGFRTKELKTCL